MMGWGGGGGWGGGWSMFGGLQMLLWWGLVIVAIVLVVRWFSAGGGRGDKRPGEDSALTILRERYARGEVTKEEFEARRRDLQ